MSYKFKYIEHTADIAAEIEAGSFWELLAGGLQLYNKSVLINDIDVFEDKKELKMLIKGNDEAEILVNFMNELNYMLFVKKQVCSEIILIDDISASEKNISVKTMQINSIKDKLKVEIKAITHHQMNFSNQNGNYFVRVIFDI